MTKEYSPFTPGKPVPVDFFVGRRTQIEQLSEKVARSTTSGLQTGFLSGERGIGKSSLASFVKHLVEREYKAVGLHTFLGGVTTLTEMARRIFDRLLKESVDKTWHGNVRQFFGDHVRQVGLFGVSLEFGASQRDLQHIVHDFAPALRKLTQQLSDEKKSIFIILDDINGLAASVEFANWLKSLVDEIVTSAEPLPVCLLLVGLEERRNSLVSLQPSLTRVLDPLDIEGWKDDETREFYQQTFSNVDIRVTDDALALLVPYAGGLPVVAHEIGEATFNVDQDNVVDSNDAFGGIVGAAEVVGRKYIQPRVFQAIQSRRYREVLRKVAKATEDFEFSRGSVLAGLREGEKKVFDNFLRRMRELGVIVRVPERGKGIYRFVNRLHYAYFLIEAETADEKSPP